MAPMNKEELFDLDFTRRAPDPVAPTRETALQVDAEIGSLRPGQAGNFVCYARAGGSRAQAAPDAPIIVVEDDEVTRKVLERALTLSGYPVRVAADSREFLQLMKKPPLPRLILLDVELPHVSGFKILSLLRQHPQTSAIPLVMLTGRSENKDLLHALSLGADGYLSKPVTLATLRSTLDRLLRRAA
jgi:CheY-like chemotaxis protein